MTQDDVQQAAERLAQAGEAVSVRSVRQALGYGSFRDIAQHLHTLHGESLDVPAEPPGGEEGEEAHVLPVCTEVGLAPIAHDEAVDVVAEAERAVQRAKERLAQAEARVPELERQLAELREAMHQATLRHMVLAFEASRGFLADTDPELKASQVDMWDASRAHREATERLAQAPHAINSARGAVRTAQQQLFLARERPELVQALVAVQAEDAPDATQPDAYARYCAWKQRLASARAACEAAVRGQDSRGGTP